MRLTMSALGHKRTCAVQKPMSALPPIATAKADFRKRSCLLYPRKRTCAVQLGDVRLGPIADIGIYSITSSARESDTLRPKWSWGRAQKLTEVGADLERESAFELSFALARAFPA